MREGSPDTQIQSTWLHRPRKEEQEGGGGSGKKEKKKKIKQWKEERREKKPTQGEKSLREEKVTRDGFVHPKKRSLT